MIEQGNGLQWWPKDVTNPHEGVWAALRQIKRNQEYRRLNDLMHLSLYGNAKAPGFSPYAFNRMPGRMHARLSLNVVKNMIGAVVSKIAAKNKVKPTFLTMGGNYSDKRKARGLENLVQGVFYDQKLYKKQKAIFRDACIFGPGALKIFNDDDCLHYERTPGWELHVDDQDAYDGNPRRMYQEKFYDRAVAIKLFPNAADAIRKASRSPIDGENLTDSADTTADLIPIVEAWSLPSVKGADDGRRVVCIENATLADVEYPHQYFPFAIMRWNEDPMFYFGTGLAYELAGIQGEINDLLLEIQRGHRLVKGHWLVPEGSRVNFKHINDDIAALVKFAGQPPTYYVPNIIPPEVYQHLWNLYQKAYEISGISQLSATGQKPAGLDSGIAQRTYEDIQSERFMEVGTMLEEWTMEVTEQTVDRCRDIAASNGFVVNARSKDALERIDFRDVDLDKDSYIIQVFPTSLLPSTPSGRLQFVTDMVNMQNPLMPPEDAFDLLQLPDTDGYAKRVNAPRKLVERNLEEILEKGKWVSPEPFDNHVLAIRLFNESIADARLDGVPPENIALARRYIALSVRLKAQEEAPPPPPPGPPADQGAPPDMAGAPPMPPPDAAPPPPEMAA